MSNFPVRIAERSEERQYSVMTFNGSTNVVLSRWPNCEVTMEREDNRTHHGIPEEIQTFGEGSEYGKAAREEAKRSRQRKGYQHDMQPWRLTVSDAEKTRQYRSIREGGAGEHSDYWVFVRRGDDFVAQKVTDWHQFLPCTTHRTLDYDQAEEQFQRGEHAYEWQARNEEQYTPAPLGIDSAEPTRKRRKVRPHSIKRRAATSTAQFDDHFGGDPESLELDYARSSSDEGRGYDYMPDSGSDSDRDTKTGDKRVLDDFCSLIRRRIFSKPPFADKLWYYGRLTRDQSDAELNHRGIDGDYLVRDSESNPGDYSISLKAAGGNRHVRVKGVTATGHFTIGTQSFSSMDDLLQHYTTVPIFSSRQERLFLVKALPRNRMLTN